MAKDLIRYDLLVQDALKGVVRKLLADAAKEGLHGDHHFYISFRTDYPGVRLSQRMREKYPQDMTIVLQHQFWDLGVTEHTFEVGLSFSGIPERLLIPFDAITGFFDPSVQFGLKFELQGTGSEDAPAGPEAKLPVPSTTPGAASEPVVIEPRRTSVPALAKESSPPKLPAGKAREADKGAGKDVVSPDGAKADQPPAVSGAEVVSLDAFRKKS